MKRILFASSILFVIVLFAVLYRNILSGYASGLVFATSDEQLCSDKTHNQISDEMIASWDSLFREQRIEENPFAMMMYFIYAFSLLDNDSSTTCYTLQDILSSKKSNMRSNTIVTCAIMQKLGWDMQCFFNDQECYLGLHFDSSWTIRRGHWVEKGGKAYYLKEFDDHTAVGFLKIVDPAETYQSLTVRERMPKPLPRVNSLPPFDGSFYEIPLQWAYREKYFSIAARIPVDQVTWSGNLPPSLYGMVASGIQELENTDLVKQLEFLVSEFDEFDQVNVLLKLCHSESVFVYDNTLPIRSVSIQLYEGRNDCDGRSVFLYCLLRTVLGYDDADIVFITWPNHLALGLKPMTAQTEEILSTYGHSVNDKYYILDPAFIGETYWGNKMEHLTEDCEIIHSLQTPNPKL